MINKISKGILVVVFRFQRTFPKIIKNDYGLIFTSDIIIMTYASGMGTSL